MDRKLSIKDEISEFLLYTAPSGEVKVVGSHLDDAIREAAKRAMCRGGSIC